jgi:hypothetical protein
VEASEEDRQTMGRRRAAFAESIDEADRGYAQVLTRGLGRRGEWTPCLSEGAQLVYPLEVCHLARHRCGGGLVYFLGCLRLSIAA